MEWMAFSERVYYNRGGNDEKPADLLTRHADTWAYANASPFLDAGCGMASWLPMSLLHLGWHRIICSFLEKFEMGPPGPPKRGTSSGTCSPFRATYSGERA